jgi:hypothetical protein
LTFAHERNRYRSSTYYSHRPLVILHIDTIIKGIVI